MILTNQEFKDFLEANFDFLFYVGKRTGFLKKNMNFMGFIHLELKAKFECRQRFLKNPELLDEYLSQHLDGFKPGRIKILEGYRKRISGNFVILKYLKQHAVFVDLKTSKVYLVKALTDRFDKLVPGSPKMVKATILPLKDKIIYDGFLEPFKIKFGKAFKNALNMTYKNAKEKNELITEIG